MRRREFITILGGAAAWPLAARAQQMPLVGFLRSTPLSDATYLVTAFREGLKEAGFVEGTNVAVEYQSAEGQTDKLPALVADLIRRHAAVIVGNIDSALSAKAATTTVPIVFVIGDDPVALGLVPSLNRPGGNVTGVVFLTAVLGTKRLELLRQLVPQAKSIGMLVYPSAEGGREQSDVQAVTQASGQELIVLHASTDEDIDAAFASFAHGGIGAVLVGSSAFNNSRRKRIVALAARYRLPACFSNREAVTDGGLMSYGARLTEAYHQAAIYTGRILKGEKPADLPVMQSTKFDLVLNLKTAKTLGLDVPAKLLALADDVIE